METLLQDLRYGARMLLKKPGFTLVAVVTLALGIGANTAIFSFVNAVVLRPLPYRAPGELVNVWESEPGRGIPQSTVSYADFLDWREQAKGFAATEPGLLFAPPATDQIENLKS